MSEGYYQQRNDERKREEDGREREKKAKAEKKENEHTYTKRQKYICCLVEREVPI